jgi:iron complex transport system permease protein
MMKARFFKRILFALIIILLILIILNLSLGQISIPLTEFFTNQPIYAYVLVNIRIPRLLVVFFSGVALALSGSILQSISRNDLADPGIIGINAGAGLGVTVFFLIFVFEARTFAYLLPVVAFLGGLLSAVVIFLLSYHKNHGIHPYKMILMGVGFSMAASGLMVLLISSAERDQVAFITNWLAGNVWGGDWPYVYFTLPIMLVLMVYLVFQTQTLNIIQLGDQQAKSLGVALKKKVFQYLLVATMLASISVALVGNISFIGLLAPHIAKQLVGQRNQRFLPLAALIGGNLLLMADLLARNIIQPNGLPTGILVAVIGAPYFIYLIIKK